MTEDVYRWRCAPAHLRTRRQLTAAGLRPNGQDVQAVIPFRWRGREQVCHLFDVNLAAPKRKPTPAQLAALEKATRARQYRAAERRGIDLRENDSADLDPGWFCETGADAVDWLPHDTEPPF